MHATHTVHALPDSRLAGGRLEDDVYLLPHAVTLFLCTRVWRETHAPNGPDERQQLAPPWAAVRAFLKVGVALQRSCRQT